MIADAHESDDPVDPIDKILENVEKVLYPHGRDSAPARAVGEAARGSGPK
tara:strand:- start:253 stop:402 length:150 start_codon:yes stop_codon:yes gene_type:complete